MDNNFPDFTPAPNQGGDPALYELENAAIDPAGVLWERLRGLADWTGQSIVDLGCGSGFWLERYAARAATVFGVEPDPRLLPLARARAEDSIVQAGSAEHIPLPDASVDMVHARFAYFFPSTSNDCSTGLAEVLRVLKPGGSLVVIDNDHRNGDFAQLLAASHWATSQGEESYIRDWWVQRGAERHEVLSAWRFDSAADCESVLRLEFPAAVVDNWVRQHPERRELSYGYVLYHLRRPRAETGS